MRLFADLVRLMRAFFANLAYWLRTPSPLPRWGFILSVLVVAGVVALGLSGFTPND